MEREYLDYDEVCAVNQMQEDMPDLKEMRAYMKALIKNLYTLDPDIEQFEDDLDRLAYMLDVKMPAPDVRIQIEKKVPWKQTA
jgi:hypothetical protein